MKKLLAMILALVLMLSFASCGETQESESESESLNESASETSAPTFDTLAGKTPKELYNMALAQFMSMTNFSLDIKENMITSYVGMEDLVDEYDTNYKTDGAAVQFSNADSELLYVDGFLYATVGSSKEKLSMSAEEFADDYTLNREGLMLPLEDSCFDGVKFVLEGELYCLNILVAVEDFVKYVGFQTSNEAEYKVAFDANGNLISISCVACYIAQSSVTVTMDRTVSVKDIGAIATMSVPANAAEFRVPPTAESIDKTVLESRDGVSDTTEKTNYVKLVIEGYKEPIIIRLYPDVAPATVDNFKNLVAAGFYNNLTIHRIKKDFVIQGGDPKGDGTGGSDKTIFGEFMANGFTNNLSHDKGVVSMARNSNNMDSASSQFFIVQGTDVKGSLDGYYAAFGYVVWGMDVVDAIAALEVGDNEAPTSKVTITAATFVNVQ